MSLSSLSHPEQLLVLLLQLGLQLPQPLLHVAVAFLCLKTGENRNASSFLCQDVSVYSILSELTRASLISFDFP